MGYEVRTDVFEGPFDLLLHLILAQEVDLWEVSLATIVDAYLTELERMERLDLEVATEFLLIAATLVDLKARRLLPAPESFDLDEELMRFEERDLLLARLLECKTFKDVAATLAARLREGDRAVIRRAGPEAPFSSLVPDPLEHATPQMLRRAAVRALTGQLPTSVDTEHIAPIRASVRDAIDTLLVMIPSDGPVTFRQLTVGVTDRLEFIVRFLGVLELYKQGIVDLEQTSNFGSLVLRRLEPRTGLDAVSVADWDDAQPIVGAEA
jgi:segregation and condensation protein A